MIPGGTMPKEPNRDRARPWGQPPKPPTEAESILHAEFDNRTKVQITISRADTAVATSVKTTSLDKAIEVLSAAWPLVNQEQPDDD